MSNWQDVGLVSSAVALETAELVPPRSACPEDDVANACLARVVLNPAGSSGKHQSAPMPQ